MTTTTLDRPASKARTPKGQREPYVPATERMPNPDIYFTTADYIDQQAAMGAFDGAPRGTVGILHYLWRHTARNDMPGEVRGWVLSGKARLAKIASECDTSHETAKRALTWLEGHGWLEKLRDFDNSLSIRVQVELADHTLRSGRPHPGVTETTPSGQPDHTSQGSYKDLLQVNQDVSDVANESETPGHGDSLVPSGSSVPSPVQGAALVPVQYDPEVSQYDWSDPTIRGYLAGLLGIPVGTIKESLWSWLQEIDDGSDFLDTWIKPCGDAARSRAKSNPIGYFRRALDQKLQEPTR